MKDMPAALLVSLSKRDTQLMHRVFERVVDKAGDIDPALAELARRGIALWQCGQRMCMGWPRGK